MSNENVYSTLISTKILFVVLLFIIIYSLHNFENIKISCISTPIKKEISLLSHVAKKVTTRQYLQNCL